MDPASWMSAAIRTGPGTARLGCAIDVAITLAALWSLVDARLFVREPVSAKRLAAMAAFCALLLAPGYAEVTAERAAFLAASLSLAIQPLARRSASSPGACLHLARALRLARAASPLSPPAAATGAGLHIAAALFLLEARHSRFVGTHIRGFFGCRGFALAAIYRKRELVVEDLRDQRSEDAYFESCRRLEFNPHERLFVLRAILRVEWKALTAVVVANTLNEVATHCRRLVFVAIIAALGGERSTSAADLAVMFALWQLLALTTLASQYIATIERGISLRITSVLSSKILEININSRFSVYSTMGLTSTADAFGTGVVSLERAISSALSQAVNVWIVASKVGWWFMIPVAIVSTHEVLSYLLSSKTRRLQDRREREEQPKYWQDFYAMAPFMRAIKFYAWEEVFRGVVGYLDIVRTQPAIWRIAMHVVNTLGCATSQIASAITITSYIRSAGVARYSDVSLLMGSIASLAAFTSTASGIARTCISMERGSRFVREVAAEDKERYIHREPVAGTTSVVLEDCTFSWGADKFSLPRMTLSIAAGEFVTVVGRVGSGKSSLVSALCGEMPLVDGAGRLCGRIGYVSQKPRVMDGTFRENVLMGEDYDEKLFWQIIHACALTHDLEQMDSSDLTRVGYNGVNLSGGQVARLALARALYRQADVYIFDDLLAAVDSRVERHLVQHVLCAEGIIGSKTRILVTHATHVVPLSSRVITLSEGHVDIATQMPAPFSGGLLDIPTPPDSGSDVEASDVAAEAKPFVVHLEDEKPPLRWSHLAKFAQLSGYWVLAAVAILKIAGF
ncbi:Canalicular multispecific organic anion transporter 1, partial [Coemansia biformis]